MNGTVRALAIVALIAVPFDASALNARTFVGSNGSDANACTLAQPCRSFAAAIAQTSSGGEVIVLDSAGYGPVAISQSVTITAAAGIYAGITASTGAGILITGSGLRVVLRGLTLNGAGAFDGIDVYPSDSEVRIERCKVRGFASDGIRTGGANLRVYIEDCETSGSQLGVFVQDGSVVHLERVSITENSAGGLAIGVATDNKSAEVVVRDSIIRNSFSGVDALAGGSNRTHRLIIERTIVTDNSYAGVRVGTGSATSGGVATVTRSSIANNGVHGVSLLCGSGGAYRLTVEDSVLSDNGTSGIDANGAGCLATAGRNTVVRNGVGFSNSAASFTSFGNNELSDNGAPTSGPITPGVFH